MNRSRLATTGIGSLPHHNMDAALQYSFRHSIPFLPQTPIRNSWEYMIPQAVEGMPGIIVEGNGSVLLNSDIWMHETKRLGEKLALAFANSPNQDFALEAFLPSAAVSSSWQAFLWELNERSIRHAKIQIAGPLTTQWSIRRRDKTSAADIEGFGSQVYQLILARSLAMVRAMRSKGIQPLVFLDEPGLYAFSAEKPRHLLAFQELKLLIQSLRKEGALVGLHCCSNSNWTRILDLGLTHLSIDVELSLNSLLSAEHKAATQKFLAGGGTLSLGVIPTGRSSTTHAFKPELVATQLLSTFQTALKDDDWVRTLLNQSLYTPACGLALHTVEDAEWIVDALSTFTARLGELVSKHP